MPCCMAAKIEDIRHNMLGNRAFDHAGQAGDGDAVRTAGVQIDAVVAD